MNAVAVKFFFRWTCRPPAARMQQKCSRARSRNCNWLLHARLMLVSGTSWRIARAILSFAFSSLLT